ncbi:porin family protein [Arcticibacterium luteifluviistationis]|uniref:Outer membrane protein beta-barrel domain-containing protein n=1 Tax=Arcticibacterium luteifluviistationis TaxID=1784714 RepID=A0A2Z4GF56_9BACT|nr:porin family protein [Arcticibacterium luteifluviistationis]AWV99618.1 hypothetical protein DJ013_16140 [Arcticibacterium luteifluviistationis]
MKKLLSISAVLIALITIPNLAKAQDTSWGPMIGVNGSSIPDFPLSANKTGVNLGAFLNHSKHEHLGLKVEAFYSQMGSNFNGFEDKIEMHYIQVPLYGVWYLNDKGNDFRPKIMLGPYLGFLAGASGSNTSGNNFTGENFKSIDFGGKAAAGFNWKLNPKIWLNTEFYFGGSFANIYKTDIINIKNQNLGLNLGLSFPVK